MHRLVSGGRPSRGALNFQFLSCRATTGHLIHIGVVWLRWASGNGTASLARELHPGNKELPCDDLAVEETCAFRASQLRPGGNRNGSNRDNTITGQAQWPPRCAPPMRPPDAGALEPPSSRLPAQYPALPDCKFSSRTVFRNTLPARLSSSALRRDSSAVRHSALRRHVAGERITGAA